MPATGVLSSWLALATKSVRTRSSLPTGRAVRRITKNATMAVSTMTTQSMIRLVVRNPCASESTCETGVAARSAAACPW